MINPELNIVLKKMWALKEKMDSGEVLLESEGEYWEEHIKDIETYYKKNYIMWSIQYSIHNKYRFR